MATAMLVPVTFFMDPVPALAAIVTATAMAIFSGDIPGALLRIPGTPASAAYTNEAFALTRQGKSELVLGTGLVASVLGGIFGSGILTFSAPILAEFALQFSSMEYFWLVSLGLTCAAFISTGQPAKGLISLLIGLLLSTVGIDGTTGFPRFTFGSIELLGGISFIPAMVGMFAMSEVLRSVTALKARPRFEQAAVGNVFKGLSPIFRRYWKNLIRGGIIASWSAPCPVPVATSRPGSRMRRRRSFPRNRRNSVPATSKGSSMRPVPTTPPSPGLGFRRWCSACRAIRSPRSSSACSM